MTKEGAIKHWKVIEALKEGKTVQIKPKDGKWEDREDPNFSPDFEYRIKPEFENIWIVTYTYCGITKIYNLFYDKEAAEQVRAKLLGEGYCYPQVVEYVRKDS